jgi:DNA-binding transcriptional regulator YiaG
MSKLNLRQAREKAGVSVEFVAEQMGVSVELVKSWEAGERDLQRWHRALVCPCCTV